MTESRQFPVLPEAPVLPGWFPRLDGPFRRWLSAVEHNPQQFNPCSRMIRRNTNCRHMIDDHHGPSAGRANLLVRAMDGILGTHSRCRTATWWRRIRISAVFHASSRRDSRSHAATLVIRRETNRRHMIGDHHDRTAGRQPCWSGPWTTFSVRTARRCARKPDPRVRFPCRESQAAHGNPFLSCARVINSLHLACHLLCHQRSPTG